MVDFHNADICWAIYKVDLDDDGNPLDPVITDCSKKFQDAINVSNAIGLTYRDISHETNLFFKNQCYDAAYNKKYIRDRLIVPQYGHWISYTLAQADKVGQCIFTFSEIDDVEEKSIKAEKAWKTSELAITCAKILRGKENFHTSIPKVLEVLSKAIMPDRLYLLIVTGDVAHVMFEWRRSQDLYSAHDLFDGYSIEKLLKWQKNLGKGNDVVILSDILSLDALTNKSIAIMQEHNLENIIFVPMYYSDKLIGFFVIDNFENSHILDIKELMETVSFFIVSEFINNQLMDDLKTDILTQVRNRNAFDAKVSELEHSNSSLGVVYADVNGLKFVNDTRGHDFGDILIKQAAEHLSSVFRQKDIYRIGGDEFVVLMDGIPQESFMKRCDALHASVKSNLDISIAIGESWTKNSKEIKNIMKVADTKMYESKQAFYASRMLASSPQAS